MSSQKDRTNEDNNYGRRGRRPNRDENPIDQSFKVSEEDKSEENKEKETSKSRSN